MIKFLLDENVPPAVGLFLREKGFDVAEIAQALESGAQDDAVIALAHLQERVLLTFDKHFSNILSYPPGSHSGIIRIRIHPPQINDIVSSLQQLFQKLDIETVSGSLIVLEREGFRVRRVPPGSQ